MLKNEVKPVTIKVSQDNSVIYERDFSLVEGDILTVRQYADRTLISQDDMAIKDGVLTLC